MLRFEKGPYSYCIQNIIQSNTYTMKKKNFFMILIVKEDGLSDSY